MTTDAWSTAEWTSDDAAKQSEGAVSASQAENPALEKAQIETRQWSLYKPWDNTAFPKLERISPVYPPPGTSEVGDKIRARRGHRGLTPLDGVLLNAPELAVSRLPSSYTSDKQIQAKMSPAYRMDGTRMLVLSEIRTACQVIFENFL